LTRPSATAPGGAAKGSPGLTPPSAKEQPGGADKAPPGLTRPGAQAAGGAAKESPGLTRSESRAPSGAEKAAPSLRAKAPSGTAKGAPSLARPRAQAAGRGRSGQGRLGGGRLGSKSLRALIALRTASYGVRTLGAAEEPERHLVRMIKEIGISRALALLPPHLSLAVRGIREVGRLLAGLGHER
jgi:hypothetical protein